MDSIHLTLPSSLQASLNYRARSEGVTLDQYLIYALTEHLKSTKPYNVVPRHDLTEQRLRFDALVTSLGNPTEEEIDVAYASWEDGTPDPDLDSEIEARLRAKISAAREQLRT